MTRGVLPEALHLDGIGPFRFRSTVRFDVTDVRGDVMISSEEAGICALGENASEALDDLLDELSIAWRECVLGGQGHPELRRWLLDNVEGPARADRRSARRNHIYAPYRTYRQWA